MEDDSYFLYLVPGSHEKILLSVTTMSDWAIKKAQILVGSGSGDWKRYKCDPDQSPLVIQVYIWVRARMWIIGPDADTLSVMTESFDNCPGYVWSDASLTAHMTAFFSRSLICSVWHLSLVKSQLFGRSHRFYRCLKVQIQMIKTTIAQYRSFAVGQSSVTGFL